ncbi:hypothetical protein C8R45DRAFT_921638 [Mycena sanguinolenta]|nr:hypothetical protein C8R45DRAFT_921638 [Mycena sanguinolenta]
MWVYYRASLITALFCFKLSCELYSCHSEWVKERSGEDEHTFIVAQLAFGDHFPRISNSTLDILEVNLASGTQTKHLSTECIMNELSLQSDFCVLTAVDSVIILHWRSHTAVKLQCASPNTRFYLALIPGYAVILLWVHRRPDRIFLLCEATLQKHFVPLGNDIDQIASLEVEELLHGAQLIHELEGSTLPLETNIRFTHSNTLTVCPSPLAPHEYRVWVSIHKTSWMPNTNATIARLLSLRLRVPHSRMSDDDLQLHVRSSTPLASEGVKQIEGLTFSGHGFSTIGSITWPISGTQAITTTSRFFISYLTVTDVDGVRGEVDLPQALGDRALIHVSPHAAMNGWLTTGGRTGASAVAFNAARASSEMTWGGEVSGNLQVRARGVRRHGRAGYHAPRSAPSRGWTVVRLNANERARLVFKPSGPKWSSWLLEANQRSASEEKPSLETDLQFGEISLLLAKVGQLEEIRRNFSKFSPLPTYPQFAELQLPSGLPSDQTMKPSREAAGEILAHGRRGCAYTTVTLRGCRSPFISPLSFPSLATTSSYDAKEFIDSATEGTFCAYFQCSEHHISSEQVFESLSQTMVEEEQLGFCTNLQYVVSIYTIRMTQHTGAFVVVHAALHMLAKQVYMYPTLHAGRDFPMQTSDSSCARAPSPVASGNLLTLLRNFATFQLGFPGGTPISQTRTVPGACSWAHTARRKLWLL